MGVIILATTIVKKWKRTEHTLRRRLHGDADARLGEIQDPHETGQVIGKCGHLGCRSTASTSLLFAVQEATA